MFHSFGTFEFKELCKKFDKLIKAQLVIIIGVIILVFSFALICILRGCDIIIWPWVWIIIPFVSIIFIFILSSVVFFYLFLKGEKK